MIRARGFGHALLLLLASSAAHAAPALGQDPITFTETRCVRADVDALHSAITDYAAYSALDDGIQCEVPIRGKMKCVDMVKSQARVKDPARNWVVEDGRLVTTRALVLLVLQPIGLGEENVDVYPRMLLGCVSESPAAARFDHHCKQLKSADNFGMESFESKVSAEAGCEGDAASTRLSYTIQLLTDPTHVRRIEDAVMGKFSLLRSVIDLDRFIRALFDQSKFFTDYYRAFYAAWAARVETATEARSDSSEN